MKERIKECMRKVINYIGYDVTDEALEAFFGRFIPTRGEIDDVGCEENTLKVWYHLKGVNLTEMIYFGPSEDENIINVYIRLHDPNIDDVPSWLFQGNVVTGEIIKLR